MKIPVFHRLAITAVSLVLISATDASAWGGCPCHWIQSAHDVTRTVVRQENQQVREQVKSSIEQQTGDLNTHLDTKVQELITALMGLSRENSNHQLAQIEANKRFGDAEQINEMNRMRDEYRANAESGNFDPTPESCLLLDMYRARSGGGSGIGTTGSDVMAEVEVWLGGESEVVRQGGSKLATHIAEKQLEYETYGGSTHGTTDWGLLLDHPTVDFSDPAVAELSALIARYAIDSTPSRAVTDAERESSGGIDRIAKMEEIRSRQQAGAKSIEMVFNMRAPTMDGEPVEAFRAKAEQSAYNREIGDKLSELQQIDILTVSHYAPRGDRAVNLASGRGMNIKGWLHEIHRIMAVNTRINYLRLELASRDAIVNAASLATQVDE